MSESGEEERWDEAQEPQPRKSRTGKRRILGIIAALAVVVGVFVFALPQVADYAQVWDVVKGLVATRQARRPARHLSPRCG